MGGTTFSCTAQGGTVGEAFHNAVEQALYDYGHAGYTGTIAECEGYTVIQSLPLTMAEAVNLGNKLIDDDDPRINDKWGPAGAIYVNEEGQDPWYFFGWASC
jgi:hypothetical protein